MYKSEYHQIKFNNHNVIFISNNHDILPRNINEILNIIYNNINSKILLEFGENINPKELMDPLLNLIFEKFPDNSIPSDIRIKYLGFDNQYLLYHSDLKDLTFEEIVKYYIKPFMENIENFNISNIETPFQKWLKEEAFFQILSNFDFLIINNEKISKIEIIEILRNTWMQIMDYCILKEVSKITNQNYIVVLGFYHYNNIVKNIFKYENTVIY